MTKVLPASFISGVKARTSGNNLAGKDQEISAREAVRFYAASKNKEIVRGGEADFFKTMPARHKVALPWYAAGLLHMRLASGATDDQGKPVHGGPHVAESGKYHRHRELAKDCFEQYEKAMRLAPASVHIPIRS